ncbi:unnamed protein product [Alopecurus aequalis]
MANMVNASIAKTKAHVKGTMKWLSHMSTFVLKHMASLIRIGVRTDKGFKEVHLHACAKALFKHRGAEMHVIFSYGLATDKHAMGSGDPLGTPLLEDPETQESDTVVNDGPDKPADAPSHGGKRKRGAQGDDEIQAFASMMEAVKEVATTIRESKPTDMHSDLYDAVMDAVGFTKEALMLALGHLIDHKAQGVNFVGMAEQHRTLWLRTFLGKYYKD